MTMDESVRRAVGDVLGYGDPDVCGACKRPISVGEWPFCPHGFPERPLAVIDDQIVGGARYFENLGHDPVYIETKSQLRAELKARNLREHVRHVGVPGSDRSSETSRWV